MMQKAFVVKVTGEDLTQMNKMTFARWLIGIFDTKLSTTVEVYDPVNLTFDWTTPRALGKWTQPEPVVKVEEG